MKSQKQPWIVKVQEPDKKMMWAGNFYANGRQDAKRSARLFVSEHFSEDVKILSIARGRLDICFEGEEIEFDEDESK